MDRQRGRIDKPLSPSSWVCFKKTPIKRNLPVYFQMTPVNPPCGFTILSVLLARFSGVGCALTELCDIGKGHTAIEWDAH